MYAVNSYTKHNREAHLLAQYLASETAQDQRFDALKIGPSNLKVQNSEKVQANVALKALFAQKDYAVVQGPLPDNYWSELKTFAGDICNGTINDGNLNDKLSQLIAGLEA